MDLASDVSANLHVWLTYAIILGAIVLFALETFEIELISLGVVVILILIFTISPYRAPDGSVPVTPESLLAGFANPGLITVLSLLVVGQALFQTDALEPVAGGLMRLLGRYGSLAGTVVLVFVGAVSAFLNNTPVVVMSLPIVAAVAARQRIAASRLMMPLSFIAILGGMTTLIGSSTNLLAADVAHRTGLPPIGMFDFTVPALVLAVVGGIYVVGILPRLLPDRAKLGAITGGSGKQFIAEIEIGHGHPLVGERAVSGLFPKLKDMTVRLVQRGERPVLPPFENITLRPGDTLVVAATRQALTRALAGGKAELAAGGGEDGEEGAVRPGSEFITAEVVVAPGSRLAGRTIPQSGIRTETGCIVLGIERRSRMPRGPIADIRLEPGDVLLVGGTAEQVESFRPNRDLLLLEGSKAEVPLRRNATWALAIFALVVLFAATNKVPIVVIALTGALATILTGTLNVRQAARAVDRRIFMLIGASLAMATALQGTGGATLLARELVALVNGTSTTLVLSALFLLVALITNVLSNNAAAVLFTPIAVEMANRLGAPAMPFVVAVILGANCSFATPIGYQTNLLVMGPGHYRFNDFIRAGAPLVFLLWAVYSLFAPWYYGL